jgi:plasmid stabilization system protein ParE
MRRLVFRAQADRELAQAIEWYKARDLRVAVDFIETVERILRAIQDNPFQYQAIDGNIRRATMRHFPYMIVYAVTETELIVVSCFHAVRDPNLLRDRLR